jgi:hypothetical protein
MEGALGERVENMDYFLVPTVITGFGAGLVMLVVFLRGMRASI